MSTDESNSELLLLIVQHLRASPHLQGVAAELERTLLQNSLLPRVFRWNGQSVNATINELMLSKYSHIPDRFLASLVSQQLTVAGTSLLGHGRASAALDQQRSQQRQSEILRSWYSGSPRLSRTLYQRETGAAALPQSSSCRRSTNSQIEKFILNRRPFKQLWSTVGHCSNVFCLCLDRTNTRLFTGSDDFLIKMWDVRSGRLMRTFRGHTGVLSDLCVSPDNQWLASCSYDMTVRIWSITTPNESSSNGVFDTMNLGMPIAVLQCHVKELYRVMFAPMWSPGFRRLITISLDGTARIFNCDNFNVDPLLLFAGSRLPLPVQLQREQLQRWTDEIVAAGRQCPMGFVEGDVCDWVQYASLLSPNTAVARAQSHTVPVDMATFGECLSMDCHPSGAEICVSNNQAGIKVYSLYPAPQLLAYTCVARVDQFPSARRFGNGPQSVSTKPVEISRVAYSHSGVLIATGGQDGGIATWLRPPQQNPSDGPVQLIRLGCTVLRSQQATLSALAASRSAPRGQAVMQLKWSADDLHLLAAGGTFVMVIAVDHSSGELSSQRVLSLHTNDIHIMSLHPVLPNVILTAGRDGMIKLTNWSTGQPAQHQLECLYQSLDAVFATDGTFFIISNDNGSIHYHSCIPPTQAVADSKFTADALQIAQNQHTVPLEQFFQRDYLPIAVDAFGNVVDVEMQVMPYRLPNGPLGDYNLIPVDDNLFSFHARISIAESVQFEAEQARIEQLYQEWRVHQQQPHAHQFALRPRSQTSKTGPAQPVVVTETEYDIDVHKHFHDILEEEEAEAEAVRMAERAERQRLREIRHAEAARRAREERYRRRHGELIELPSSDSQDSDRDRDDDFVVDDLDERYERPRHRLRRVRDSSDSDHHVNREIHDDSDVGHDDDYEEKQSRRRRRSERQSKRRRTNSSATSPSKYRERSESDSDDAAEEVEQSARAPQTMSDKLLARHMSRSNAPVSDWLQPSKSDASVFVPQVGDRVVICVDGLAEISPATAQTLRQQFSSLIDARIIQVQYCTVNKTDQYGVNFISVFARLQLRFVQNVIPDRMRPTEINRSIMLVSNDGLQIQFSRPVRHQASQRPQNDSPATRRTTRSNAADDLVFEDSPSIIVRSRVSQVRLNRRILDNVRLNASFLSENEVDAVDFTLDYADNTNQPEFIVPHSLFQASMQRHWFSGDQFRVWYPDVQQWFNGHIMVNMNNSEASASLTEPVQNSSSRTRRQAATTTSSTSDNIQQSNQVKSSWKSLSGVFDDPNYVETFSPWEIEPVSESEAGPVLPCIFPDEVERVKLLLNEIRTLSLNSSMMFHSLYSRFESDQSEATSKVAVPMSLTRISDRLNSKYYRTLRAVLRDFSQIRINTELLGRSRTNLVLAAIDLEYLAWRRLFAVSDETCVSLFFGGKYAFSSAESNVEHVSSSQPFYHSYNSSSRNQVKQVGEPPVLKVPGCPSFPDLSLFSRPALLDAWIDEVNCGRNDFAARASAQVVPQERQNIAAIANVASPAASAWQESSLNSVEGSSSSALNPFSNMANNSIVKSENSGMKLRIAIRSPSSTVPASVSFSSAPELNDAVLNEHSVATTVLPADMSLESVERTRQLSDSVFRLSLSAETRYALRQLHAHQRCDSSLALLKSEAAIVMAPSAFAAFVNPVASEERCWIRVRRVGQGYLPLAGPCATRLELSELAQCNESVFQLQKHASIDDSEDDDDDDLPEARVMPSRLQRRALEGSDSDSHADWSVSEVSDDEPVDEESDEEETYRRRRKTNRRRVSDESSEEFSD